MANQKIKEQAENKIRLISEIDETIQAVCKKVKEGEFAPGEYTETVKALAELTRARALL